MTMAVAETKVRLATWRFGKTVSTAQKLKKDTAHALLGRDGKTLTLTCNIVECWITLKKSWNRETYLPYSR